MRSAGTLLILIVFLLLGAELLGEVHHYLVVHGYFGPQMGLTEKPHTFCSTSHPAILQHLPVFISVDEKINCFKAHRIMF